LKQLEYFNSNGLKWRKDKQHQHQQHRKRGQKWITPALSKAI